MSISSDKPDNADTLNTHAGIPAPAEVPQPLHEVSPQVSQDSMWPEFDYLGCTCPAHDHHPLMHDDGFGCTVEGCSCIAGWSFQ